jgi:hypothetical protein
MSSGIMRTSDLSNKTICILPQSHETILLSGKDLLEGATAVSILPTAFLYNNQC